MQKIVSCRCSQCSNEITFVVPEEKIRRGTFPIILQKQHGVPPHKLMILITHNFQVKPFAVEDATPASPQASAFLNELFEKIGLSQEEYEAYFLSLQERPLTLSELSQIAQMSLNKASILAEKLVEKGFFKKVNNHETYYIPLPPYTAILAQFEHIAECVQSFQDQIPKELEQSFKALEEQAKDLRDPQDFLEILKAILAGVSAMMSASLSQIFAKINQGTSIVGQFWDRTKRGNHLNQKMVVEESSRIQVTTQTNSTSSIEEISPRVSRNPLAPNSQLDRSEIISKLEALEEKVNEFESGSDAADNIQQLHGMFQKEMGYTPILHDMLNWINQLRHGFSWDQQGKDVLRKRVKYWEDKISDHLSNPSF